LKQEYFRNFVKALSQALEESGYMYILWDPTYTEDYPYHIAGLRARDLDKILRSFSLLRISENVYVRSSRLHFKLRRVLWLGYRGGTRLYRIAKGAYKRKLFMRNKRMSLLYG